MTLKELEPQLLALSDDEKAQVVQLLSQGKITLGRGIEKSRSVCGGRLIAQGSIQELLAGDRSQFYMTVRGDGLTTRERLKNIPWIKTIVLEEGLPDVDNNRTTKLQINVTNPNVAENELLRLVMMADSEVVVTEFGRVSYELEDVFVD